MHLFCLFFFIPARSALESERLRERESWSVIQLPRRPSSRSVREATNYLQTHSKGLVEQKGDAEERDLKVKRPGFSVSPSWATFVTACERPEQRRASLDVSLTVGRRSPASETVVSVCVWGGRKRRRRRDADQPIQDAWACLGLQEKTSRERRPFFCLLAPGWWGGGGS